jgi:threonylcarbamoyladenosine tRNA methylthiotransferase MtaB
MQKKVSFNTLGCRLNISETGSIADQFAKEGYRIVNFGEEADVTFINTCTVTDGADSSCRNLIRKAHKASPAGKLIVAGCYAQMEANKIKDIEGVNLILGTTEKFNALKYLKQLDQSESSKIITETNIHKEFRPAMTSKADSHTRAFLKIQDGCNYICSYCIIPFARGRSVTIPIEDAIKMAKESIQNGFKEIVLTGVNIGEYEHTSKEALSDLVKRLLDLKGLARLRLSSVEMNTITDDLLAVLKDHPKFMDHFHIPLQSGDDEILSLMRRKYSKTQYKELIHKIKSFFPNASIGADTIVGFPGESQEQYQNTLNLLKELPITHFHVFPFSKRQGTMASRLEDDISHEIKKMRVNELIQLGNEKLSQFSHQMVGQINPVLFEKRDEFNNYEGYTTNYLRVYVRTPLELKNEIQNVEIVEYRDNKLWGILL